MATSKVMNLGIEVTMNSKGVVTGVKQVEGAVVKGGKAAKQASKGFGQLNKAMGALGVTIGAAGLYRGLNSTIQAFGTFEQQIKNVQNITGSADAEMAKFASQLQALPPTLGSAVELTKGLYQALSSGIPKDNAIEFMTVNAKAAKGNLADLTQTISASTSILAAFNLDASEAESVLDSMTKTVDLGKLTFSDLANNIGKSAAISAAAGVSYNELFAAAAQLTLGGLSVEEAMTGIRAIMTASISPTEQQAEAMQKYGVELSANAIQQQGFVGYMKSISNAVGGNVTAMAELFPNVRAIGPALALVREEGDQFDSILQQIQDSSGKVGSNFANMSNSVTGKSAAMKVSFEQMKITIGESLAPAFMSFADWAIENLPKIADAIVTIIDQLNFLAESAKYLAPILAALWGVNKIAVWNAAIVKATGSVAGLTAAGGKMASALTSAAAGFAVIGIAAAAAIKGIDMYADSLREVANAGMAIVMQANEQEAALLKEMQAQNAARESMGQSRVTMQEYAEGIGAVKDGEIATAKAIFDRLAQMNVAGDITADQHRILAAYAGTTQKTADAQSSFGRSIATVKKELQAAAPKMKLAKVLLAESLETVRALGADIRQFNKEQADLAKKSKEAALVISTGYQEADNAVKDWIVEMEAAGVTIEELQEAGEDGFSALDRAIQDAVASASASLKEDLPQSAEQAAAEAAERANYELQFIADPKAMEGPKKSLFSGITGGLSEALGKGFMGEWSTFSDLWDSLWQDAAKSMMGIIGDAFGGLLESGDFKGFFDKIEGEAGVGSVVGGLGMVMQGREQGGAQGALQGAMGGMMAGAVFGPIGMAVGAIAGGLLSFFGGKDDPRMTFSIGAGGETGISSARGQKLSDEEKQQWERDVRTMYNTLADGYRGAFLAMGQDLWDLVGDAPTFDTGSSHSGPGAIHMDDQAILEWLGDVKLPELFESQYFEAFNQGLQNFGMNAATVQTLFEELDELSGAERIAGLTEFVTTVRAMSERMESIGWDALNESLDPDALGNYLEQMGEIGTQMDVMAGGWEDMDLLDVAREVNAVGTAFDGVTAATADMLSALRQLRDGIAEGWADFREDLMLSGMSEGEQVAHYRNQVQSALGDLLEADTMEEVNAANEEMMAAMQALSGMVDLDAVADGFGGGTWRELLDMWAEMAAGAADETLQTVEDEVQAAYQAMVDRVTAANDALMHFAEALDDVSGGGGGGGLGGDGGGGPFVDNENQHKSLTLNQPMTIKLDAYLDGTPLQARVDATMRQYMESMTDYIVNVLTPPPVID